MTTLITMTTMIAMTTMMAMMKIDRMKNEESKERDQKVSNEIAKSAQSTQNKST